MGRTGSICTVLMLAASAPLTAQRDSLPQTDSTAIVTVRLSDGSSLTGRVVARDDSSLTLLTIAGLRVVAPRRSVLSWRAERGRVVEGRLQQNDPNTSRLFFAPTGRTLRAGEGYFADYFLFFPFIAVGFHDRLTFAGGISLLPGAESQLLYIAPKVGLLASDRLNLAAGALFMTVPEEGSAGAAYGALTLGGEDQALTLVGGFGFAEGERSEPGLVVGFEQRVSDRSKFLLEAWRLPGVEEVMPAIFGMRFFGQRITVDFGLMHFFGAESEGFPFFPWVDFVVSW
jgi:hypothetical protein